MSDFRRREFSRRGFLQLGALAAAPPAARPNILFLMADQFRYDCLGANGNRLIRTPNLDRLAAQSANFSNAFVQSPVCVPSRISWFTGRYPHSHRNRVNYTPCDPREVLLQKRLQDAGYRTGSVGKLHLTPGTAEHARSTGFDVVQMEDGISRTDINSDYVKWRKENDPRSAISYLATVKNPGPGVNPYRGEIEYRYTPTAWVGEKTREILRDFTASGSSGRPFFLYSSFFKPHAPHTVSPPYDSMFNGVDIPLPPVTTLDQIHALPKPVQAMILRGKPEYGLDRTRLEWIYRSYYGGIAMVDYEMGLILDQLEKSGLAQNTIVVFSTDHGDQLLEHGLEGKNVFFEGSEHIPFLVKFPGRVRARRYTELMETVDLVPSLLEFAGLSVPQNCQGRSFVPLVSGSGYTPREIVFAENIIPEVITGGGMEMPFVPGKGVGEIRHPDSKMARTARWKLNHYPGNGGELYDLANDPGETRNLYADPAHAGVVADLRRQMLDWMITADETEQIAPRWLI
jgi:arylsulfatase